MSRPSALQTLVEQRPSSQVDSADPTPEQTALQQLALQVAHNLRYQHNWTQVRVHRPSSAAHHDRPIISGRPPQRLYVHPDEQIEFLQRQARTAGPQAPMSAEASLAPEREWVLPSHLREKWSLRRLAAVFDGLEREPPRSAGEAVFERVREDDDDGAAATEQSSSWRDAQPKRLVLATLDDDSTVVYYIVHDGIVKPRQN